MEGEDSSEEPEKKAPNAFWPTMTDEASHPGPSQSETPTNLPDLDVPLGQSTRPPPSHIMPGTTSREASPEPIHFSAMSPEAAATWSHSREVLGNSTYYYDMRRANSISNQPRVANHEVYTIRNNHMITSIERIVADFRQQLLACHYWRNDNALFDMWMRLREAREGMETLLPPGTGVVASEEGGGVRDEDDGGDTEEGAGSAPAQE